MRAIESADKINWIPRGAGYAIRQGEATGTITGQQEASGHDVTGIALFGSSGESCALRTRRRGLSRLATHVEHSDQKARGLSRADADRAQREVVCADCDRAG